MIAVAEWRGLGNRIEKLAKDGLPFFQRHPAQIDTVQIDQVERHKTKPPFCACNSVLKSLKAGTPIGFEDHNFAVDDRVLDAEFRNRIDQIRELAGPILFTATPESNLVT